jgi:cell division protein FtsI (penicillin-binding protein 3)
MKSRILILFIVLIALWSGLVIRAGYLQVLPNERLKAIHERQFKTVITLNNRRGAIVDRKGRELAVSTSAYSVFADPKIIEKRKQTAKKIASELGFSADTVYAKIKDPNKRFIWLARQISKEKANEIKELEIKGISVVEDFKREYPNEHMLAHTLGMIGNEGQGLEGIELQYDHQLQGNRKKVSIKRDARGRPLIADGMMFAENPDGAEVRLTIDSEMQHMLEGELREAVQEFQAQQAFGIILDAHTSAILAMVNTHQFDANIASKTSFDTRRNRLITDAFEPGSTMKTFAIAGALREKIVAPNKKYNTENGMMKVADRVIREAESSHAWKHLTVSEILAFSSNIGTAKIAFEMGEEKLRKVLTDFGFGSKLGVDLPGEVKGSLQALPWNQHLLSNVSFGQGVAVTPLQIANAYAAIANGGTLNTPYIVQSIRDTETGETTEMSPKPIRKVLSSEDAAAMRLMLAAVTGPGGTGVNAKVEGFMVAGKTGTAQKVSLSSRGYTKGAYISSFAGFFPANDPKYVIYVVVDQPSKSSYYGSVVAAPVFSKIASYTARMEGLAPVLLSEKNLVPGPAFRVSEGPKSKRDKKGVVKKSNISSSHVSSMAAQELRSPASLKAAEPVIQKTMLTAAELSARQNLEPMKVVPVLKELSTREVIRKMSGVDVKINFVGSGVVSETYPQAGDALPENGKLTIILK